MTNVLLECDALRETFREWYAEQETLDSQLSESLAALSAYQSHLDAWQQQLAREREELQKAREAFEQDRAPAIQATPAEIPPPTNSPPGVRPSRQRSGDSPVLGSIMEQFGKLRQQRASGRQAFKKPAR